MSTYTLAVSSPYRLDLSADALRRLAANSVDALDDAGTVYRRAFSDDRGTHVIHVSQPGARSINVQIDGPGGECRLATVERMLGMRVKLTQWYKRVEPYPWLAYLARELRGLRPPRYPTLWEALAHAIVFQQISIHAAGAIMRRVVETLGTPVAAGALELYPFPGPLAVLSADDLVLRNAGLSANKISHLRSAATSLLHGAISEERIESLPSAQAAEELARVRGIGPWSAAVVLLRGFGRLDVFPRNDSGVARSIRMLSGDPHLDVEQMLEHLGPAKGMLYFHLLLGRTRNLVMPSAD